MRANKGLGIAEAHAVARALLTFTAPEVPTNAGFESLGGFSAANAYPVMRSPEGGYVSLQTYRVAEALCTTNLRNLRTMRRFFGNMPGRD